jgi:hypothetical protein
MEIDIGSILGSVTRTVRRLDKDGKPASTVTLTRLYDTNVGDLWDALTNAERLPRWFLPIEGDLKLGGAVSAQGECLRDDYSLRTAASICRDMGVWRRDLVDRGYGRTGLWTSATDAGAYGDHRRPLEPIWPRRGGYRLGPGTYGTGAASVDWRFCGPCGG